MDAQSRLDAIAKNDAGNVHVRHDEVNGEVIIAITGPDIITKALTVSRLDAVALFHALRKNVRGCA